MTALFSIGAELSGDLPRTKHISARDKSKSDKSALPRSLHPTREVKWVWLLRRMKGESAAQIARTDGRSYGVVALALQKLGISNGRVHRRWMLRIEAPPIARKAFASQRDQAAIRGIAWRIDFEQWWRIWAASGKWDMRGRNKGQFCMARTGDIGPYAEWNVRICTVTENQAERVFLNWTRKEANRHG